MTDITDGVPFLQAVHYQVGRDGRQVDMLILHWMDTDLAGADATFTGGGRIASATYGIQDTTIHQYVRESDGSFNAADWDANMRSIAIEHSAAPGRDATVATIETSVQVCVAMMRKYPAIGNRVFPHNQFFGTSCPGTLPWQYIRDEALRRVASGWTATPTPPPAPAPTPPPTPSTPTPTGDDMLGYLARRASNGQVVFITANGVHSVPDMGHLNNLTKLGFGYSPRQETSGSWYSLDDGAFQSLVESFGGLK